MQKSIGKPQIWDANVAETP